MSTASKLVIVIGNKRYSSWSLRGWLALKIASAQNNFTFNEILIPVAGAGNPDAAKVAEARQRLLQYSPTGKVPCLIDNDLNVKICESLAICLYISDKFPNLNLLPQDPVARGLCIAASAEMHAGFSAIRSNFPMNCLIIGRKHGEAAYAKPEVKQDIERLKALWEDSLSRFGTKEKTSYLFGANITCADIMFAPVAFRFQTYDPDRKFLSSACYEYIDTILAHPFMRQWVEEAKLEGPEMIIPQYETTADS